MQASGKKLYIHKSDGAKRKRNKNRGDRAIIKGTPRIPYGKVIDQVGSDSMRMYQYLKRYINTEMHYNDTTAIGVASSSTASFILLNGITQGDTTNTRTGSSVKSDNVQIAYSMYLGAVAVQTYERVMVVVDRQANGAIFAIGALLNATNWLSPYVPEGQKRFLVLHDEAFTMNSVAGPASFVKKINCSLQDHVEYNLGNAGTIADINTNSIYLIHFSNQAVNTATFDYYCRYWFVDN